MRLRISGMEHANYFLPTAPTEHPVLRQITTVINKVVRAIRRARKDVYQLFAKPALLSSIAETR